MQYNPSYQQWRFAPHQTDICHTKKDNVGDDYASWKTWTDLFGWGAWLSGEDPLQTQNDNPEKYLSVVTAGEIPNSYTPVISNNWTPLTTAEFLYLFSYDSYNNDKRSGKYGVARVDGVKGMVLLPNDWATPNGVTDFNPGVNFDFIYENQNDYSADDWAKMESAGAVFLPAAGYRDDTEFYLVGGYGYYWSVSAIEEDNAWLLYFDANRVMDKSDDRNEGFSVRLVRALP